MLFRSIVIISRIITQCGSKIESDMLRVGGNFMRAYLVQHGKSKPAEEDPDRGLTEEGREEVIRMAKFLHDLRFSVSLIQHSPKKRAEETAHIFNEFIRNSGGSYTADGLSPTDDPSMTANFLKIYDDDIM